MAYTEADLTAIRAARLRGVRVVTNHDGRSVTYASLEEMRQLEQDIASQLNTNTARTKQFFGVASKGF